MAMDGAHWVGLNQVLGRLRSFRLFQGLPDELLQDIARFSEVKVLPVGSVLFTQGEMDEGGLAVFILLDGQATEWRTEGDREVFRRTAREGDALGFRGILEGDVRLSSARARERSTVLRLPAAFFVRLQAQYPELVERLLKPAVARRLRAMPLLASLTDDQLRWMVDLFVPREFHPGETILDTSQHRALDSGSATAPPSLRISEAALCLIDCGQVVTHRARMRHMVLTAGHYFGSHEALGVRRVAIARAVTPAAMYCLEATDFDWLLSAYPGVREVLGRPPDVPQRLRATRLFANLTRDELNALAGYVCWEYHPARETVTQQGEPGDAFYILNHGEAIVRAVDPQGQERPRNYLSEGDYFGETSLILREPRDATVEAITPTDWLVLHHDDLMRFLQGHPGAQRRLGLREETRAKLKESSTVRAGEEEPILFRVRRHWWVLFSRIAFPLVAVTLLLLFFKTELSLGARAGAEVALILLVIGGLYIAWVVVDWTNDWLILTTRRVIHQERVLLISESRVEAPLEKIQDINILRDLWGNMVGYGHLIIQTAATVGRIEFRYAARPEAVRRLISDQMDRARAGAEAISRERIRRELEERLQLRLPPEPPRVAVPPEAIPGTPRQPSRRPRRRLRFPLFSTREEEEDRITWRKHPLNLLFRAVRPLTALAIMIALSWLVARYWKTLQGYGGEVPAFFLLTLAWLFVLGWLIWVYDDWHNDLYIVTRDRIIDIEKKPLFFAENRREATLDMIQNVTSDIPNPIAYLLGYGNVTIQTAAETGVFDFVFVPNPREVQAEISRRVETFRAEQAAREQARREAEMAAWFDAYHRLRREPPPSDRE